MSIYEWKRKWKKETMKKWHIKKLYGFTLWVTYYFGVFLNAFRDKCWVVLPPFKEHNECLEATDLKNLKKL